MVGLFVARMLFAVTVMVAALLLAPTASFAHAGHDHGPATTDVTKQSPVIQEAEDQARYQKAGMATAEPQSFLVQTRLVGKAKVVCAGGCCTAASPSCCAVSTPAMLGLLEPPFGRPVFVTVHAEGAGIVPGMLPEPPKSLV